FAERMRPFVKDTTRLLHEALAAGKGVLFEAAQGSLLDVDHGTYPYVTSSNSSPAGIWSGSGVPARRLERVVGVLKAYTTRAGRSTRPYPAGVPTFPRQGGWPISRPRRAAIWTA